MENGLVKHSNIAAPGLQGRSRRAEYLLVIYPHGELQDKLQEQQQQFSAEYGLPVVARNRPHITVAAFQAVELMEDTLIRWIQRICNRYPAFDLTLNNFSGFPPAQASADSRDNAGFSWQRNPGTIYVRVQDPQPFQELMRQLRSIDDFIRSNGCPPLNLIGRPYLSIAGGLTQRVYDRAMPEYSRRDFHESFRVDQLVLLKREHAFDACKTVNVFRLLPE